MRGLSITAEYADGKKNKVNTADCMFSGFDSSACGEYTVKVFYGGKSVSFTVTVTHDHVFEGEYVESRHPHRSYSLCMCGEVNYLDNGTLRSDCPECNNTNIVYGDVNMDFDITTDDARLVLRIAVGVEQVSAEQLIAADVDGIAGVTTDDARLLLRYALNLDNLRVG